MGGVLAAYMLTLGIVSYRWASGPGQAPPPITLVAAGGLFGVAALAGRADERLGNALAWAITVGAVFAPRSKLAPVRQVFAPGLAIIGTGGPHYHHLGDPNTVPLDPKKIYYIKNPNGPGYIPVYGTGRPVPGGRPVPRLLPGMHQLPIGSVSI